MNGSVAYILMGFPRVSETFIASEIHRVEQAGVPLRLYVIKPVEEREQGHDHPVLDAIEATPEYLPDPQGLTKPLHLWRYRDIREFLPALRRCVAPPPARRRARRRGPRSRRPSATAARRFSGPRKIYIKELIQAITLADRARHARRPPPARALRARDDDDHLAGGLHHRAAVLASPATRATSTRPS